MYHRTETVTAIDGIFIPFINTLTDTELSLFINIIENQLVNVAIFHNATIDDTSLTIESLWETKEDYINAENATNDLVRSVLDGKCSTDYYHDTTKFTINVVEEIL